MHCTKIQHSGWQVCTGTTRFVAMLPHCKCIVCHIPGHCQHGFLHLISAHVILAMWRVFTQLCTHVCSGLSRKSAAAPLGPWLPPADPPAPPPPPPKNPVPLFVEEDDQLERELQAMDERAARAAAMKVPVPRRAAVLTCRTLQCYIMRTDSLWH